MLDVVAAACGRASAPLAVGVGAPKAYPAYVTRRGDGSVLIGFFDAPAVARVDSDGRILALDGRATTAKVDVERVEAVDLERFVRSFAAAESAWGPAGQLSPRDTVRAEIGTARLMVDYVRRPRKRGRVTFGQVVPWNRVWRTGANAATQLSTDAMLWVDGRTIPPGQYQSVDHPHDFGRDADRQPSDRPVGHGVRCEPGLGSPGDDPGIPH